MHEISLLDNVREILEAHAQTQNFTQVKKLTLEIGRLSCVESEALRFGFDVVMKDSIAESAELELRYIEAKGRCEACQKMVIIEQLYDPCSECGHAFVTLLEGNEMRIKDLIVV